MAQPDHVATANGLAPPTKTGPSVSNFAEGRREGYRVGSKAADQCRSPFDVPLFPEKFVFPNLSERVSCELFNLELIAGHLHIRIGTAKPYG
jgi:hypothetical protein